MENIPNKRVVNESIFEDVMAALYDQDVAFTKLKRLSSEFATNGGVRE